MWPHQTHNAHYRESYNMRAMIFLEMSTLSTIGVCVTCVFHEMYAAVSALVARPLALFLIYITCFFLIQEMHAAVSALVARPLASFLIYTTCFVNRRNVCDGQCVSCPTARIISYINSAFCFNCVPVAGHWSSSNKCSLHPVV